MPERNDFEPDWVSPPGDTISDILAEREIPLEKFAHRMEMPLTQARKLLRGSAALDLVTAQKLEAQLGPSAGFWLRRENQFRTDAARPAKSDGVEWLQELPIADMVRFGWIERARTADAKLRACLEFFGVTSLDDWREHYRSTLAVASFRASTAFKANSAAVAAWLRQAELISNKINCKLWDAEGFRQSLPEIKKLTRRKDPAIFLPILRNICANYGVAVVVVRAPSGCRASGATRFLSPTKAMIVLSFRYLSDDQFWFTFFHEVGHVLLHGTDPLFLEDGSDVTSNEENEANEFAARALIPDDLAPSLWALRASTRDVIRFARLAGVSPGIVVGQLQHLGRIPLNRLNSLKRRYCWSTIPRADISP